MAAAESPDQVCFAGVQLQTRPGKVMVPRPATEALVERAVALIGEQPWRVADAGTGSGAIACLLAVRCPNVHIVATDTNPAALTLAEENAARLGVASRVRFVRSHLLDEVEGPFDLVAANLPYLPAHTPDPSYRDEPEDAIYGTGSDGLGLYRQLIVGCRGKLAPSGTLIIQLHGRPLSAHTTELDEFAALLMGSENPAAERI